MDSYFDFVDLPILKASEFVPYSGELELVAILNKIGCHFKINEQNQVVSIIALANQFTDRHVATLANLPWLRELKIVSAKQCDGISKSGVSKLFESTKLISLQLMGLTSIDTQAIELCFACKSLIFLEVNGCAVAELNSISSVHSQLQYLRLAFCDVSCHSIEFLSSLKTLKRLHLLGTNMFKDDRDKLAKLLPDCTIVLDK